jgi:signal transduction histidine kinase
MLFSVVVMIGLGLLLDRYSRRMDERISKEQADKETQMRRELTQNISHELKTPVTSILGYTETLLDHPEMDDNTRLMFIERTQSQANRLAALLQDISTLNRMDYASDMFSITPVNVSKIVADVVKETELRATSKNIVVLNCLDQDIIVNGNESLIYSVFSNLMDNAINYSGDWTTIVICAYDHNDYWQFTFSDNGIGIDAEHLPRIFERFYRIDKGRSRSLGGTGLGLSIVKNAVLLHGGTIIAKAEEDGGVRFEFTLKKSGAHQKQTKNV